MTFGVSSRISDLQVLRTARQIINLYPEEPEFAVCQRADAAYEQGDMFNFELWQRVTKAVKLLLYTRPSNPQAIN